MTVSILKLIAAMRRRQAAAVEPEPVDPRTIARRRQYQTAADQAHTSRLPATDDDVIAADAAALLAEVTRVQQDPLLDVPLQRDASEVGGVALYPPFNPLGGGR